MNPFIHTLRTPAALVVLALVATGCYYDKSKRNIEYAPNMYNSLPLEPYSQTEMNDVWIGGNYVGIPQDGKVKYFADGLAAQRAPEGTVPRASSWYIEEAYTPYPHPNTLEGYEAANTYLSPLNNPATNATDFNCSQQSYERGKVVYETFCIMCHGAAGDGKGILVQKGVYGGVPAYSTLNLTAGKMFHSITWGKNSMGSYAAQITPQQRWEVICYIQEFQEKGQAAAAPAAPATPAVAATN